VSLRSKGNVNVAKIAELLWWRRTQETRRAVQNQGKAVKSVKEKLSAATGNRQELLIFSPP